MCGRFAQFRRTVEYANALGRSGERQMGDLVPRYNVAPGEAPLLARVERLGATPTIAPAKWGVVPHWAKEGTTMPQPINARAETVATKPMFRDAFRATRALVPVDAYYEWAVRDGRKQPYAIALKSEKPMFLAAIWSLHKGPGGEIPTFAIVVGPANELVSQIHDRAPIVMARQSYEAWLDPANHNVEALAAMLVPTPAEDWSIVPVSTAVNSAKNKGAECMTPVGAALTTDR